MFHPREIFKASTSQKGDIGRQISSTTPSPHKRSAREAGLRFSRITPTQFEAEVAQQAEELQDSAAPPSSNTRSKRKRAPIDEKKALKEPQKRIRRDVKTIVPDQASALEDLKKKYLLVGDNDLPPTFEDSKITFIIDGKSTSNV